MKYTKGPWEVNSYIDDGRISQFGIRTISGSSIASVYPLTLSADANAHLIAAAPDLLENAESALIELNDLLQEIKTLRPGSYRASTTIVNLEKAIKKAKGK